MRTASDPLRASRKRIAELWNLGNVDLDRLGRLVDPVVDRFLHARDVDSVIALDPGQRTELAQEIWRAAERAGGDVQTSGAALEAAGRSERRKRVQRGDHRFADIPPSRIAGVHRPCVTRAGACAASALDEKR
jgi:hypothetical protein